MLELCREGWTGELSLPHEPVALAWTRKAFDEYGIADMGYWYPRESPGFGCARGETLARVRASFREAKARMGERALASAWYSCSPAYSNRPDAVWHLRPK